MKQTDCKAIWKTTLEKIKVKLTPETFETWFSQTQLVNIENNLAQIGCKNSYISSALEGKFHNMVKNTLAETTENDIEIVFVIKPELAMQKKEETTVSLFEEDRTKNVNVEKRAKSSGLNPSYTFKRFVVGSANRLAHAAAMAVGENPGKSYNPLFIYGGVGLGKTHLLQAIANYALAHNPDLHILYTSTEKFLIELIDGIRRQTMSAFRDKYRSLDMFILDDVQFISGKEKTQDEFFNTFNTLYQEGKQIVVASDRPPSDISRLEERVRSRLEGGLVADISPPDFEMRLAILRKRTEEESLTISEAILIVIAEEVKHNIRELEGALMTVSAYIQSANNPPSVNDIRTMLKKNKGSIKQKINPELVLDSVSEHFGITVADLLGKSRTADVALARQVVMFLLRDLMDIPLKKVAGIVRRTDHTTVIHAFKKIEEMVKNDANFRQKTEEIRLSISQKVQESELQSSK